ERAVTPIDCSTMARRPAVTCSPEATTASYSRASCSVAAERHHSTSWLVAPAKAETTTATWWPASTSRLTWRATLRMRSRSATEVPPNFITRRLMGNAGAPNSRRLQSLGATGAGTKRRVYTYSADPAAATATVRRRRNDGPTLLGQQRRQAGSRALCGAGRRVVGPARPHGHAAQAKPDPSRLY